MALNFPSSPTLNQTYTVDNRTWQWNGTFWRAISTTVGYTGSQGPAGGYTGSRGDYGPQGYAGSAGYTGSASTIPGYTGSLGYSGSRGYTGSQGTGFTGSAGVGIPTGGIAGQVIIKNSSTNYDIVWGNVGSGSGLSPWTRVTANYTVNNGDRLVADTTGGGFTITLPANPQTGNYVQITDGGGWATNNLIIARNGKTIEGYSDDIAVDLANTTIEFIYDGTQWQVTSTTGAQGPSGSYAGLGYTGSQGTVGYAGSQGASLSPWFVVTSNYTADNLDRIIANTTAGSFTITLPAMPSTGDYIQITDGASFATNNLIINRNGKFIEGYSDNVLIDINSTTVELLYDGVQWQITSTTGAQGERGYTGSSGAFAAIGFSGSRGYTGSQGFGFTGSQGDTGYSGSRGYSGSLGYTGSQGAGFTGSQGYTGSTGYTGSRGYNGSTGFTGSTGAGGVTYTVTNNGTMSYVIAGSEDPTLTLIKGFTYYFVINATGHPFWIKSVQGNGTGNAYTSGVTNNGVDSGTIVFTVPFNAPSTLYYNCQIHSMMTGVLNIADSMQGYTGSTGALGYTGSIGYTGSKGTSSFTYGDNPPASPVVGDWWMDTSIGVNFMWTYDGTSYQWVEMAASGFIGGVGYTGSAGVGYTGSSGAYAAVGFTGSFGYTGSQGTIGRAIAAAIIFGG